MGERELVEPVWHQFADIDLVCLELDDFTKGCYCVVSGVVKVG
jgi:hypothetical protein